jgi:intein/homing endonuclease
MNDGSRKKIKDVKVNDIVQSFNPITLEYSNTKVVNQYVRKTDKRIYKITTVSGREIIATYDHKFMTAEGWKEVQHFTNDTKLGISLQQNHRYNTISPQSIINTNQIERIKNVFNLKTSLVEKYCNQLNEYFTVISEIRLVKLSKIIGFILSDGSLNVYRHSGPQCGASFGSFESAQEYINDVSSLGFKNRKIIEGTRQCNGVSHHTFDVTYNGAFPFLLLLLDTMYGKKTETMSYIPAWILNGENLIKISFLSGLFGGDGSKIRFNKMKCNRYNYTLNTLSMSKCQLHTDSLVHFFTDIKNMLELFEIKVNYINIKSGKHNKNVVHLGMNQSEKNIITFFDVVGYGYDTAKRNESGIVVEYLRYKYKIRKERVQNINIVRNMIDKKYSNIDISKMCSFTTQEISDIRRSYKNNRNITFSKKNNIPIEDFIKYIQFDKNHLFVNIASITLLPNKNVISDITVESNNHTFIGGNNFLVHNSAMGKQAMGLYALNYQDRIDSFSHVLHYPQRPLVQTESMTTFKFDEMPSGINAVVAIGCYGGQNQEDSVIMNQSAIDRGLFRSYFYRTYKDEQKQQGVNSKEVFEKPKKNECMGMFMGNYSNIDDDGLVSPGQFVNENDIIIGKTTTIIPDNKGFCKKDSSTMLRNNEHGTVDKVMVSTNEHGVNLIKTRIRSLRKPEMGDKFCGDSLFDVLTNEGWKPIATVTTNDSVATLNPNNHNVEYQNVQETYKFKHCGDMYRIKSQQVDLYTTLNHKMYVKKRRQNHFQLIEAKDIVGKRVSYKKNGNNINGDYQFCLEDGTTFEMDLFLQFFGFWIAEGWATRKTRNKSTINYLITLCQVKHDTKQWIIEIIKSLGLHPCLHNHDEINISHKQLAKYLITLSVGSINKFLPDWVWKLSERQSRLLLFGLIQGDGNVSNSGSVRYFTSSIKLRDDIQRLSLQAGWSASFKKCEEAGVEFTIRNKRVKTNADSWRLNINKRKNEPTVNHEHVKEQKIQEEYIDSNFDGHVYCILVPNHIFYVRRNGIPVWTGNSSRHKMTVSKSTLPQICGHYLWDKQLAIRN